MHFWDAFELLLESRCERLMGFSLFTGAAIGRSASHWPASSQCEPSFGRAFRRRLALASLLPLVGTLNCVDTIEPEEEPQIALIPVSCPPWHQNLLRRFPRIIFFC